MAWAKVLGVGMGVGWADTVPFGGRIDGIARGWVRRLPGRHICSGPAVLVGGAPGNQERRSEA